MMKISGISFCLIQLFAICTTTTLNELTERFAYKICIQGTFSTFSEIIDEKYLVKESNQGYSLDGTHIGNLSAILNNNNIEKSAMSKIHELAQFNGIDYFYQLEKEEGPPHNRLFTISLTLGKEQYTSEGNSLKKAQQKAATIALQSTEYERLLPKDESDIEVQKELPPTVLLNNLGAKLGVGVTYFLVNQDREEILSSTHVVQEKSKKPYIQKLNESLYSSKEFHIKKGELQKGPFKVKVQFGDHVFYAASHTIQSARHDAASQAVDFLIAQKDQINSHCLKEGSEEQCKEAKNSLKSPISLVFEAAQLRDIDVKFEIIKESGPSHKKVFVTECRLGHLTTTGEGNSKKESKKAAAESMTKQFSELGEVSRQMQVQGMLKDKKRKKKKKKLVKTNFDKISMVLDNFIDSLMGDGEKFPSGKDDINNMKKKKSDFKRPRISHQDEILELSNMLNFEVQFTDFTDKDNNYSLMNLHVDIQYICFGKGFTQEIAREKAAKGGLKLLHEIGFFDNFKDLKYSTMERDVKENIQILQVEASEES